MNKCYKPILLLSGLLSFGCKTNTGIVIETDALSESNQNIPSKVSEACTNTINLEERTSIVKQNQYTLVFPTDLLNASAMSYCFSEIDHNGAAFKIDYVDPGGSGMDGYVNGVIGGVQKDGSW